MEFTTFFSTSLCCGLEGLPPGGQSAGEGMTPYGTHSFLTLPGVRCCWSTRLPYLLLMYSLYSHHSALVRGIAIEALSTTLRIADMILVHRRSPHRRQYSCAVPGADTLKHWPRMLR